jgi:dTDP-4-amino-4,6-dideoxygalactose transaminase
VNKVPFSRPTIAGSEGRYVERAIESGLTSGGEFTVRCEGWLERRTGSPMARLAHSGTGALEAAMMLVGLSAGDEVIMPSFAYPTMATAVVREGATPVFVDIEAETLNLDPDAVRSAVGPRTRAIVAVHYGGVGCAMEELLEIAADAGALLIEDAAHCLLAEYEGRALGSIGDLGTYSFHHTKNLTCGEGGALLVNRPQLCERAEVVWEKGTDRRRFERGEVDRYTWVDVGSSFAASELSAAFLWGQLEIADEVTARRRAIWDRYHAAFAGLEQEGLLKRPGVPPGCLHNGHLYYLVLRSAGDREAFIAELAGAGIACAFHYVPLHDSPAGMEFGRVQGSIEQTEVLGSRLVRLPLWADIDERSLGRVIETSRAAVRRVAGSRA